MRTKPEQVRDLLKRFTMQDFFDLNDFLRSEEPQIHWLLLGSLKVGPDPEVKDEDRVQ